MKTTKKTVFKWQERFWTIMKKVFDENYKSKFAAAGLLKKTNGELSHFLSDGNVLTDVDVCNLC